PHAREYRDRPALAVAGERRGLDADDVADLAPRDLAALLDGGRPPPAAHGRRDPVGEADGGDALAAQAVDDLAVEAAGEHVHEHVAHLGRGDAAAAVLDHRDAALLQGRIELPAAAVHDQRAQPAAPEHHHLRQDPLDDGPAVEQLAADLHDHDPVAEE